MKTKTWILLLSGVFLISLLGSFLVLRRQPDAALAEVSSGGKVVKTVNLRENQQFTITSKNGGKNVVTVQDGKIAVTDATCPDHYCMKRGFCAPMKWMTSLFGRHTISVPEAQKPRFMQ